MNVNTPIPSNGGDIWSRFGPVWQDQIEILRSRFGSTIREVLLPRQAAVDVPVLYVEKQNLVEVLEFMKADDKFLYSFLVDITATDEYPAEPRFEVIYNLLSTVTHARLRLKVRVSEDESMPTIIRLWLGANWAEREVFDMFGINFENHPDLRRILTDDRFEGHALRKDYDIRHYQIFTEAIPVDKKRLE